MSKASQRKVSRILNARGEPTEKQANGVHFKDHGWAFKVHDDNTIVAAHPNHAPMLLTRAGEVFEVHPDGTTVLELEPILGNDDPVERITQELGNEFMQWCRRRTGKIQEAFGGSGVERPASTPPAGEAT